MLLIFVMNCTKLHHLFLEAAAFYPHHMACEFIDDNYSKHKLTYAQVMQNANIVQHCIDTNLAPPRGRSTSHRNENFVIGLYLNTNVFIPSIIVGIFQSGCSFSPINPGFPTNVVFNIVENTAMHYVILCQNDIEQFSEILCNRSITRFSFSLSIPGFQSTEFVFCQFENKQILDTMSSYFLQDLDIAYCLSTSGTTGDPKFVHVPHRCVLPNILHLRQIFKISSSDKVALCSPLTFDPSIVEIFITLSCGATLAMVSDQIKMKPTKLMDILFNDLKVTVLQPTPTLFSRFKICDLKAFAFSAESSLRLIAFGGEACPSCKTIKTWLYSQTDSLSDENTRKVQIFNLYGITEVSSWASWYEMPIADIINECEDAVPLGYPLLDTTLDIIDDQHTQLCQISSNISQSFNEKVQIERGNETFELQLNFPIDQYPNKTTFSVDGYLRIGGSKRICHLSDKSHSVVFSENDHIMRNTGDLVSLKVDCDPPNTRKSVHNNFVVLTLTNVDSYRLYYKGRTDKQVKRHGKRLNLLYVKRNIEKVPCVSTAHVVFADANYVNNDVPEKQSSCIKRSSFPVSERKLLAFVVLLDKSRGDCKKDIDRHLHETLEVHCLPDNILFVDELPMTTHGKVDEAALVRYFLDNCSKEELLCQKQESIERILLQCWNATLSGGTNIADLRDDNEIFMINLKKTHFKLNFVSCGGDSLSAVKLGSLLKDKFPQLNLETSPNLMDLILHKNFEDIYRTITEANAETKNNRESHTTLHKRKGVTTTYKNSLDVVHKKRVCDKGVFSNKPKLCYTSFRRGGVKACHGLFDEKGASSVLNPYLFECVRINHILGHSDAKLVLRESWCYNTGKCIDASPLVLSPVLSCENDSLVIIGSHSFLFTCISLSTGEPNWKTRLGGRIESSACLTLCGQYIVVGCYDCFVYVLDADDGSIVWKFKTGDQVRSSPCPGGPGSSIVFIGSHDGCLYALDAKIQCCLWKYHAGAPIFASPCYQPHRDDVEEAAVFGCSLSGQVFSLAADLGTERWLTSLGKPIFSSPCVFVAGLCVGCVDMCLYMLSYSNGDVLWKFPTGLPIFSSPALGVLKPCETTKEKQRQVLLVGSHDGSLYCVDSASGGVVWSIVVDCDSDKPSPVYSTPCPIQLIGKNKRMDLVAIASTHGNLVFLDLNTGRRVALWRLPGHVFSSPVATDHVSGKEVDEGYVITVLLGCRDDNLYCFRLLFEP